jgi:hypothetical protein
MSVLGAGFPHWLAEGISMHNPTPTKSPSLHRLVLPPVPRVIRSATLLIAFAALAASVKIGEAQTVDNWLGGTGNWNNAASWSAGVPNGGNFDVRIDNGNAVASMVTMNINPTVGRLAVDANDTLSIANAVTFFLAAGGFPGAGAVVNNGSILFNNAGSGIDWRIVGDVSLSGTGTVTMNNLANNQIFSNSGTSRLTVGNGQTIQGSGNLGAAFMSLTNNGTVTANQSTRLLIQPHNAGDFTNTASGIWEATGGGTLQLGSGLFNHSGILRAVGAGSQVQLLTGASLVGGPLTTSSGGEIRSANATLTGVTNNGSLLFNNTATVRLVTALTNNGTITFDNLGSGIDLRIVGDVNLTGTGTITLNNLPNNQIYAENGASRLTVGSGQTIQGSGNFGAAGMSLTNNGTITANQPTPLTIQPNGAGDFTNTASGIWQATSGGKLHLGPGLFNQSGILQAVGAGSQAVLLTGASLVGGPLTTSSGGEIRSANATLTGVTNNGSLLFNNTATVRLVTALTNNGTITFDNLGSGIDLRIVGNVNLTGTGTITLNNLSNNQIYAENGASRLTVGSGQTIQGSGNIGAAGMSLTNNGTIIANQSTPLNIQPNSGGDVSNGGSGVLRATNSATLQLAGGSGSLTNNGVFESINGGTFTQTGTLTNLSGTRLNGGSYNVISTGATSTLSLVGANIVTNNANIFLSGANSIFSQINSMRQNDGTFVLTNGRNFSVPALPPGPSRMSSPTGTDAFTNIDRLKLCHESSFSVDGDYAQGPDGILEIVIGEDYPNANFHHLNVTGTARLAGTLEVKLANGYTPAPDQMFEIIRAAALDSAFVTVTGATVSYTATGVFVHPTGATGTCDAQPVVEIGRIFVANRNGITVGAYTTAGATVNPALITGLNGPSSLAISGENLYVAEYTGGKIGKYTTSGTTVNASLISGLNEPGGLGLAGTDLFVTDFAGGGAGAGKIGKYTTLGATVNASLITGLSSPYNVAVSGSDVYVTNASNGTVGKYTTSGATVNASLITGLGGPLGIAVDGNDLYVTNTANGSIGKYTTSGATVNASLVSGLNFPLGIAVFGGHLYVTNYNTGTIGKYTTSGATVNASLVTGLGGPYGIAVGLVPDSLEFTAAVSRKTHGGAGTFDINLPLNGSPGVECRSSAGTHTLVFTFNHPVVSGTASVTTGTGTVSGTPTFAGNNMTVSLTGVTNAQTLTVTLSNVTDSTAQVLPDTAVSVSILIGDTNGNRSVSASDIAQTKGQSGATTTAANFRSDVNTNGSITASDISLVKSNSGSSLP